MVTSPSWSNETKRYKNEVLDVHLINSLFEKKAGPKNNLLAYHILIDSVDAASMSTQRNGKKKRPRHLSNDFDRCVRSM